MSTSQDEMVDDLCRQAEDCFRNGDRDGARQIFEAVLQIEHEHPRALAGLARLAAAPAAAPHEPEAPAADFALLPEPADAPPPGLMTLELDLSLLPSRPARPAEPERAAEVATGPVHARKAGASDPSQEDKTEALDDLLDAASDFAEPTPPPAGGPPLADVDAAQGEAALLVARARAEYDEGRYEEARLLAARALTVADTAPGAQELLNDILALAERTEREVQDLLTQAIADIDGGRPEQAVPQLRQALVLAPGHPEALEYLARAEAAGGGADRFAPVVPAAAGPAGAAAASARAASGVSTGPATGKDDLFHGFTEEDLAPVQEAPHASTYAMAGGGDTHQHIPVAAPPLPHASRARRAAHPPPLPPLPTGAQDSARAAAPDSFYAPPEEPGRPAPAPRPSATRRSRTTPSPRARTVLGLGLLTLIVIAVGAWFALPLIASGSSAGAQEPPPPPSRAAGASGSAAPQASAGGASAPAPRVTARVLTSADVPDLVRQAQAALTARNEAEAVRLLETAQELAGSPSFTLSQELETARAALRVRREADAKIAEARARFAQADFEEALRLLYRIPPGYEPPQLERWIANSWYNVGVQRMQISDMREAREFFGECLKLRPEDDGARRHLEVVRRYAGRGPDDAYRIYVNGLRLRRPND